MNWSPFDVAPIGQRPNEMRLISTIEGIGDRLRTAAFAELQAREAFRWAAQTFTDAPNELKTTWEYLAQEEDKHLGWLTSRMKALDQPVNGKTVSDQLWHSLISCQSAKQFCSFMATAEERGRRAGERFKEAMKSFDPESAKIFGQIALEEVRHIEVAKQFFGDDVTARSSQNLLPLVHEEVEHLPLVRQELRSER